jgi:NAD(P)-dependent dehydrogenase (short-subunit alcohol dehydrogenase family)
MPRRYSIPRREVRLPVPAAAGTLAAFAVQPEAIANVIAFLAGDLAAPVSGAIIPACGA